MSAHDLALRWLLDGDPAIRWQAERDLGGASERVWRASRRAVATKGWGARLLAKQRPDGHWGVAVYQPKWTCTTYTMQLLWQLGLEPGHPRALAACARYLEEGIGDDGGINFWRPRRAISETCVSGMILGQLAYFGCDDPRVDDLVAYLLDAQMPDGGWNCQRPHGATHASFHTTLSALEGLREYARGARTLARARARAIARASARGREFLLAHHLYRSHRTGRIVATELTRFHFPPQWRYDVLRALDYFQSVSAPRDPRLDDPIALLESRADRTGRWPLARPYPGAQHFLLEPTGSPSRPNTLRALRVLRWWHAATPTSPDPVERGA
jgi:hypothetical protein